MRLAFSFVVVFVAEATAFVFAFVRLAFSFVVVFVAEATAFVFAFVRAAFPVAALYVRVLFASPVFFVSAKFLVVRSKFWSATSLSNAILFSAVSLMFAFARLFDCHLNDF